MKKKPHQNKTHGTVLLLGALRQISQGCDIHDGLFLRWGWKSQQKCIFLFLWTIIIAAITLS